MTVQAIIAAADRILPGHPRENDRSRWQAIIAIADYIETEPDAIWDFVLRWGGDPLEDLRDAIATVLLEHLLEHHFELIFPRIERAVRADPHFADMFCRCWKFGQAELPSNARRFDDLQRGCGQGPVDS